jgi:putative two-component system response regulator
MLSPLTTTQPLNDAVWQIDRTIAKSIEASADERLKSARILIIDDEPLIVKVVTRFLQSHGYAAIDSTNDPRNALKMIGDFRPDLILLDIMMPYISGLDVLRSINEREKGNHLPTIILSAASDVDTKREALALGATEFLSKPVDPNDLILRVRNALIVKAHSNKLINQAKLLEEQVYQRTAQLRKSREQIVHALAKAAEYRDNETGMHVVRVGRIAGTIARELGFNDDYCRQLELAAQLHDVGKIGIPDAILLSPQRLTKDQFEVMKRHCQIGCIIVDQLVEGATRQHREWRTPQSPAEANEAGFDHDAILLTLAANITRTHHEKWNGEGYPDGLVGHQIPIEGRIASVADVYDALTSKRPYKEPFTDHQSFEIIREESGRAFEPAVVDAFLRHRNDIKQIRSMYPDTLPPALQE